MYLNTLNSSVVTERKMIELLLEKAVDCDISGQLFEARDLYIKINEFIQKSADLQDKQNEDVTKRFEEYASRALKIEVDLIAKIKSARLCNYILMERGVQEVTYDSTFGHLMDDKVIEVVIEEPRLRKIMELEHIIEFVELLIEKCENLKYLIIKTKKVAEEPATQTKFLEELSLDLLERNISLSVGYDAELTKPRIIFSNGNVVLSKRGLHFYQNEQPYRGVGSYNYAFRKCKQNEIHFYCCENLNEPLNDE